MCLFSRDASTLAASICRNVEWRGPVNPIAKRVLCGWQFRFERNIHGDGAASPVEQRCGDAGKKPRHFLRDLVDRSVRATSSYRQVDAVRHGYLDRELKSPMGFTALFSREVPIRHREDRSLAEVECFGHTSFAMGHVKGQTYRGLDADVEERTGCPYRKIATDAQGTGLGYGEEMAQGRIGGPAPGTHFGPSSLEIGFVELSVEQVDVKSELNAETEHMGNAKSNEVDCRADEVNEATFCKSSKLSVSSSKHQGTTCEDTVSCMPTDEVEPAQGNEVNTPLDNLTTGGTTEGDSQFPVPLSPLSGELAKNIEYERAMVAETAMKSGPAMTRSGVLFEDEWLMVVNKPCGMYCEHVLATVPSLLTPTTALQARGSYLSCLTLRRPVDNKDTSAPHLHMANRLDRDTSGVMVITKCRNAAGKLSNIFTKRQVQKSYIALCRGPRPLWKSLTVHSGHGRSRYGAWRVYSKQDVGRKLPGGSVVRDMSTHLMVMAINKQVVLDEQVCGRSVSDQFKDIEYLVTAGDKDSSDILTQNPNEKLNTDSKDRQSLLEIDDIVIRALPLTGRTHQIRLHCQYVGLPLRGDVKYGGPHFINGVTYDHHALHAESLSFRHPFTFEEVHFVAPLPEWARDAGVQPLTL